MYTDLGFYQELQSKFEAKGGPFAEAYVIATSTTPTTGDRRFTCTTLWVSQRYTGRKDTFMGITTSIVLLAIGAILAFAVDVSVSGVNLHAVGWILMGAGALGAVLSMAFWTSWGGFRSRTTRVDPVTGTRTSTVVDERPY